MGDVITKADGLSEPIQCDCEIYGPVLVHHDGFRPPSPAGLPVLCKLDDGSTIVGVPSPADQPHVFHVRSPLGDTILARVSAMALVRFIQVLAVTWMVKCKCLAVLLDRVGAIDLIDDFLL